MKVEAYLNNSGERIFYVPEFYDENKEIKPHISLKKKSSSPSVTIKQYKMKEDDFENLKITANALKKCELLGKTPYR